MPGWPEDAFLEPAMVHYLAWAALEDKVEYLEDIEGLPWVMRGLPEDVGSSPLPAWGLPWDAGGLPWVAGGPLWIVWGLPWDAGGLL